MKDGVSSEVMLGPIDPASDLEATYNRAAMVLRFAGKASNRTGLHKSFERDFALRQQGRMIVTVPEKTDSDPGDGV